MMKEENIMKQGKGTKIKISKGNFFNQDTLVKYEFPVVVGIHEKSDHLPQSKSSPREPNKLADGKIIDLNMKQTEETLNVILPPREWEHEGLFWRQQVSSTPATRSDVIALENQLNAKLKQRRARPFGICLIRRKLYSQCFDELIRQVTINCSERGLLLMKMRDEASMTLRAYRSLYESATAHGIRKHLMEEEKNFNIKRMVICNVREKAELELEVKELENKLIGVKQTFVELNAGVEKKHEQEMEFLMAINDQIKHQLEAIIVPPKKAVRT